MAGAPEAPGCCEMIDPLHQLSGLEKVAGPSVSSGLAAIPVPRRRWLTRVGVPAAVIVCTAALLATASGEALFPAPTVEVVRAVGKPVKVRPGTATGGPVGTVVVQAPGWVEPDPYPIFVSALTNGVIKEVLVLEGEAVKAGQVVARLVDDDAQLALARAEAAAAARQAELAEAVARLEAARTDWENPVARDRQVAVMQAQLDQVQAELAQLPAVIAEQRAILAERLVVAERLERFVRNNAATEVEAAEARYRVQAAEAALNAVIQREAILKAQAARFEAELAAAKRERELRVAEKLSLESATAAHERARAELARAEAELAEARLRLERMEVRAPVDGIVMARLVGPGDKVMLEADMPHSAHVIHLYDPKKQQVRIDIPLADAAKVSVGQRAKVIVDVLPGREFDGVVTRVVPQADIQRNTLQVKVAIENPDPVIRPEMLARAKFLSMSTRQDEGENEGDGVTDLRPFIPEEVIVGRQDDRGSVWVVSPDGTRAQKVQITLGTTRENGWIEVAEGLNPGDAVIVDGRALKEGTRVRVAGR